MKRSQKKLIYSPSDLSNHIHCRHLTELNKKEAMGEITSPEYFANPSLEALKEKGISFEQTHLSRLKQEQLRVKEIDQSERSAEEQTLEAMKEGYDVIYQARLKGENWTGWADFLLKTNTPSNLGAWSYEVWDTKLANDTKAGTILQIGLYTQQIAEIQGVDPEFMGVIKPNGIEKFRYHDYAAYIRLVKLRLEQALIRNQETYPEPVSHCDICRWWKSCNAQRRSDDHLAFVAGMGKSQVVELRKHNIHALAQLAELSLPLPFEPEKGSIHTYSRLHDQAKIQFDSRQQNFEPLIEILPAEEGRGFSLLPEPSKHDIFLDLEGSRMLEPDGLEYLIGYYYQGNYTGLWANNEAQELENFKTFMQWATKLKKANPALHIYHYAPYEPSAFKRLMGKYASCENEVDDLLRSESFVDLYRIIRHSLIASVERYSLKDMEVFFGYEREMDLRAVSLPKTTFEYLLETGDPESATSEDKDIIQAYNKDDCHALIALQTWLEKLRAEEIVKGVEIQRPEIKDGHASEHISEHQQRIQPLFEALLHDVPVSAEERNAAQEADFILAHFLDWYRREEKAHWWEYFRLMELTPDELLEERKSLSYLSFTGKSYMDKRSRVDLYSFPPQEVDLKEGELKNLAGERIGNLFSVDRENRLLEIKKGPALLDSEHVTEVIQLNKVSTQVKEESILRIAEWRVQCKSDETIDQIPVARKLLLRQAPKLQERVAGQTGIEHALRILLTLEGDYLAIQGPPGAGKSYTASHLILGLVKAGKRIGITAMSHKVILNLLLKTVEQAEKNKQEIRVIQKGGVDAAEVAWAVTNDNGEIADNRGKYDIIAGTSFMWAREELANSVDYMFVDEAGQLALIDTLALAPSAKNMVLLGDPNQLQQPQQGVHPLGTEVSALEHLLNGHQTIQKDQGIFLETTWRMHPTINALVSELFYQNRLTTEAHLSEQRLIGDLRYQVGLQLIELMHEGNSSSSLEEVGMMEGLVTKLTEGNLIYRDGEGQERPITSNDIKIISPYNAQVNLLKEAIPNVEIGTVDKFQGQESPIILYSVASSSPSDAPRGMDFLYSPNRLNVAISRAKVLFIMVASPAIFEAECKSPKEMKLANAFCRFREAANTIW